MSDLGCWISPGAQSTLCEQKWDLLVSLLTKDLCWWDDNLGRGVTNTSIGAWPSFLVYNQTLGCGINEQPKFYENFIVLLKIYIYYFIVEYE